MAGLDYAVTGNCEIASLIDPRGRHVWCCYPRLDGDPLFHALLGGETPESGYFEVRVADFAGSAQRYLPNTAIVETMLHDVHGGCVRIVDFCPRFRRYGRIFRPAMLMRRVELVSGQPRVTVVLRPGFEYGAVRPEAVAGSHHVRFAGPETAVRLTTDMPLSYLLHEADFSLGRPVSFVLGPDEPLTSAPGPLLDQFLQETMAYWQGWVADLNIPFDWQEAVIRAAITLKLCTYEDTGGVVAALTTSIPEAPGSARNWDYRFCWPRDSYFTINALNRLSATRTMENFIGYVQDTMLRDANAEIAPLFTIAPGMETEERIAPALAGFHGLGPVRIGNAAHAQRQNDAYGAIILSLAQMFFDARLPARGDLALYRRLRPLGKMAERIALTPDAGPWEFRTRADVHTFSAAMCWAALSKLGLIARAVGQIAEGDAWTAKADELREQILARAIVPNGGWISGVLDDAALDASVLLLPEIGMISATAPAFLKTLDVVEARLMRDGFLLRYETPDDFGTPETAFLVCSFWYVNALVMAGRPEAARGLFEKILERRNHVGLLSEDLDPRRGELWGNFPQTYSQVGLILSAMRLSRSWEEGMWRGLS